MAATLWNPLRCSATAPSPNVLLAAKLIALCLLVANHQAWPAGGLDILVRGVLFGAAFALLLNRYVRTSALLLGGAVAMAVAWPGAYTDLGAWFSAAFLVLVGLRKPAGSVKLLRLLVAIAYFAAAAELWATPGEAAAIRWAPWAAVALGVGFLFRRAWPYAIWLGVLFHFAAMWAAGGLLTTFHYTMLASYLVFAPWPKETLTVLYDGDCGFCETTRRFFERLDFDRIYDWQPFQGGAGDRWGIPPQALEREAHVVVDGKVYAGFRAFQAITLYNPLTYFVLALLLFAPGEGPSMFRLAVAGLAIALYFPLFRPAGEAVYQIVARNRHRLPGEKTCKVA